jgi:hypothetical protein
MGRYKSGKAPEVREDRSASAEILPLFLRRERPLFLLGRYRAARNFHVDGTQMVPAGEVQDFPIIATEGQRMVAGTPFFTVARATQPATSPHSWNAIRYSAYALA